MSNNDQNSEILDILRLVLTEVKTVSTDLQTVKNNVQTLTADMQEVKTDVREIKSWARVADNRLANMENKLVDFATELTGLDEKVGSLDEKVEARLHDTRPMWEALNLRLNTIEVELATIKENQEKSEQASQEFRQEIILRLKELEKDLHAFRRHVQIDVLSFAKDLALFEERLERVESKLEIKN